MNLGHALALAQDLAAEVAPYCARVQVAGSIRRERPDVRDLELVVVPRHGQAWWEHNLLYQAIMTKDALRRVRWISRRAGRRAVAAEAGREVLARPNLGRHLGIGATMNLDLFIAAPANYGLILLIRTVARPSPGRR